MGSFGTQDIQPLLDAGMTPITDGDVKGLPNVSITGSDNQMLTITLGVNEGIVAQPGCMMWCEEGIENEVSTGGLTNALARACCTNEDFFRVTWRNASSKPQKISLTMSSNTIVGGGEGETAARIVIPKRVVPINLDQHYGVLMISNGAFMAALDPDLEFRVHRTGRQQGGTLSKGVMGGQGFFLVELKGKSWVFLAASGTVIGKELAAGETIVVDQSAVLAWASSVHFSYRLASNLGMACCGGEGLANTTLMGPGYVVLQSVSTPASQQPNLIGLIACAIWCFCLFGCFLAPLAGALAGFEAEENGNVTAVEQDMMGGFQH